MSIFEYEAMKRYSSTSGTTYAEIFARRKFSQISPSGLIGENFITQTFCFVLMITYREDMATFTDR